jgi:glycosyltransferase involved in cell wall biosynthesis
VNNNKEKSNSLYKNDFPPISFVTITKLLSYKDLSKISKTLNSIFNAFPGYAEYIFVVSDCAGLYQEIEKLIKSFPKTQIVFTDCANSNWSSQRNRGLSYASSEIVVFVDDDMEVEKGSVERLIYSLLQDENIAAVSGAVLPRLSESIIGKCQAIILHPGGGYELVKNFPRLSQIDFFHTGFCALRKKLFLDVRFDETLKWGCEDMDISIRLKEKFLQVRFLFNPQAVSYHPTRNRISEIFRWMRRYGRGRADIFVRHKIPMPNFFTHKLLLPLLPSMILPIFSPVFFLLFYFFYFLKLKRKFKFQIDKIVSSQEKFKVLFFLPFIFWVMNFAFDLGRLEFLIKHYVKKLV